MSILKPGLKPAICSDHAGYELKQFLIGYLESKGIEVDDFGTYSTESCDYPDYAHPAAKAVEEGRNYPGIAMCGSGEGISITLNKHQGIRAALCWEPELGRLARQHNDANFIVFPARFIEPEKAAAILDVYLDTPFEGGRHQHRIDKIPVPGCKCE